MWQLQAASQLLLENTLDSSASSSRWESKDSNALTKAMQELVVPRVALEPGEGCRSEITDVNLS